MNIEDLKQKYAAIAGKVITSRRDNFFRLEPNRAVTFFVLINEDGATPYSSRGIWIHPIATHFLGRRYSCSNVVEPNSCYICEQLATLEEELTVMKGELEEKKKIAPLEAQKLAIEITEFEKRIQSARAQEKYAFNILVKGDETPRIFEAPKSVASPIVQVFETVLEEEGINIFDPKAATAFTVTKEGEGLLTRYKIITAPRPVPILTGEDREARVSRILQAGFNLDERYKIPSRSELVTAWENYLNGTDQQPSSSSQGATGFSAPAPPVRPSVSGPVPMSRIGGRAVTPTPPSPPPTPPPIPVAVNETSEQQQQQQHVQGNGGSPPPNGVVTPTPATVSLPEAPPPDSSHSKPLSHVSTSPPPKPDSDNVKATLLHRLKTASAKK